VWGLAFLVGTVSLIIAGSVDYRRVLLRILIPFGALYLAYQYTQKQTKQTPDAAPSPAEPVGSGHLSSN
jgi:steroid 5-alpha reductase family enzyme